MPVRYFTSEHKLNSSGEPVEVQPLIIGDNCNNVPEDSPTGMLVKLISKYNYEVSVILEKGRFGAFVKGYIINNALGELIHEGKILYKDLYQLTQRELNKNKG